MNTSELSELGKKVIKWCSGNQTGTFWFEDRGILGLDVEWTSSQGYYNKERYVGRERLLYLETFINLQRVGALNAVNNPHKYSGQTLELTLIGWEHADQLKSNEGA